MQAVYRAEWIVPISVPPVRGGWVAADRGRITALGDSSSEPPPNVETVDLGNCAILPGLVNAHTHLELSWMAGLVPPSASMPAWAAQLMTLRATVGDEPMAPAEAAIRGARAAGTSVVGDVTNTLGAYGPLAASGLSGAVFRELLGFKTADSARVVEEARAQIAAVAPVGRLRLALAPHAPYSVSPELFKAIGDACGSGPFSVHLAESAEEIRFLREGTGAWRDLLGRLGAWNERWTPPGCGPVEYLDRLGLVSSRLIAVHCVRATPGELRHLAAAGATVVTCPRSNRWTGAGAPPVDAFYGAGVRVAVGTDSLASVEDLSVFAELAELRRLAPSLPAARLLESATRDGAEALGFGRDFGTLDRGKRADLIAVRLPPGTDDVEEYLVGGIEPDAIRWLSNERLNP